MSLSIFAQLRSLNYYNGDAGAPPPAAIVPPIAADSMTTAPTPPATPVATSQPSPVPPPATGQETTATLVAQMKALPLTAATRTAIAAIDFSKVPATFAKGLNYTLADDGQVGPDDARGLRQLAKKLKRPDLDGMIKTLASQYVKPKPQTPADGSPTATAVDEYKPGPGISKETANPDLALGLPQGLGTAEGSLDVVSLGQNGTITVTLGRPTSNGITVFSNPFMMRDKKTGQPIVADAKPAKVQVSADNQTWYTLNGTAGMKPVMANSTNGIDPTSVAAGGDRFMFAGSEVPSGTQIRYVKITDLGNPGNGFNLDAVIGL